MFCENCGQQIKDNETICSNCGIRIEQSKSINNSEAIDNTNTVNKGNGKKTAIIAAAVGIVVLILIIVIAVIINSSRNSDSNNYSNSYYDSQEVVTIEETVEDYLVDLDYASKDNEINIEKSSTGYSNTGDEYSKYLFSTSPYQMISYNLHGKYDKLTAIWAICQQNKDTKDDNAFEIYVDNKKVYESKTITAGDLPEQIEVNLNSGSLLTILFTEGYGAAELGNVTLTSSGNSSNNETESITPPEWLTNIEYLNKDNNVSIDNGVHLTNTDKPYSHFIYGWADDEKCSITYYLNEKYTKLSGLWTIYQDSRDTEETSKFRIYADGNIIYESSTITSGSTPEEFEVDLNNCSKLTITFEKGDGSAELGNIKVW